jgi:hypothetical protein
MNPAILIDTIVLWFWSHKKISVLGAVSLFALMQVIPAPTVRGIPTVVNATDFNNGIRAGGVATKTTGTISSGTDQLTVAAAAGFEPGMGIVVRGAGTTNSVGAPSTPVAAVRTQSFTSVATSNITTASSTVPYAAGSQFRVDTTAADLPSGLSTGTDYYWCFATTATTNTNSNVFALSTDQSTNLACGEAVKIESTGTIASIGSFAADTMYYICWADRVIPDPKTDIIYTLNAQTDLESGDPIKFEAQSGTPSGITATTTYYWSRVDDKSGRIYTSSGNAITGGATGLVDITTTGGGGPIYMIGEEVKSHKWVQLFASSVNALANSSRIDITGTSGGTDYLVGPDLSGTTLGQLFPSAADVTANTNRIDIADAGTGTHYFVGNTTQTYGVTTFSEGGGQSVESTAVTVNNACSVGSLYSKVYICLDNVSGNNGFGFYGRHATQGSRVPLSRISSPFNCLKVATTNDIDFIPSDIGGVTSAGGQDGILLYYHPTNRVAYILPTDFETDTFPNATTITVNGRSETTTGAAVGAYYWGDGGDTATAYPHRTFRWRANTKYMPGDLVTDSSGRFYECVRGRSTFKTSAVEPTWDTDINDESGGGYESGAGDLDWRRTYIFMSASPPTSAVNNALFTTVKSRSGTTITTADNAGNSVTSQFVFHDDTTALVAQFNATRDNTNKTRTFYFGAGEYPCYLGSVSADTRWTELGIDKYGLFVMPASALNIPIKIEASSAATIKVHPLTAAGANNEDDATYSQALMILYKSSEFTVSGGNYIWQPPCEPKIENDDGESEQYFFTHADGGGKYTPRLRFEYLSIHGFPKVWGGGGPASDLDAHTFDHCFASWGATDADNLGLCGEGGRALDCVCVGMGYKRSLAIYTDGTDPTSAIWVERCHFYDATKLTCRVRCDDATFRDNWFYDCNFGIVFEDNEGDDIRDCMVSGNHFYDSLGTNTCGIYVGNAQDVVVQGNTLENATIQVSSNGGKRVVVSGNILRAGRPDTYPASGNAIAVSAVNQQVVVADNIIDQWGDHTGSGVGITLNAISNSDVIVHDNVVKSCGAGLTIGSNFSGFANIHDNKFISAINASVINCLSAAGGEVWAHHNTVDSAINTSLAFWAGGGRTVVEDSDFRVAFTTSTGLTGPFIMRGNRIIGTATLAEPSTVIQDNNFAGTVTLSGATQFTSGNSVSDSKSVTMAALASGVNNDVALPVTDQVRLDPNASNSTVTSFVARADGTEVTIICTDAGAATITIDSSAATGTAANKIMCPGDTDIVMSTGERIVIKYDATTSLWYVIGGQYVASMWERNDTELLANQLWYREELNQFVLAA